MWLLGLQQGLSLAVPESVTPPLGPYAAVSFFITFGEAACGGLLLFGRTRVAAACLLALMHISIFLMLGPMGKNLNHAVWSWNVFSALILLLTFVLGPSPATFKEVLLSLQSAARPNWRLRLGAALLLICGFIVPILGLFQLADPYPSFALYSGDVPRAVLILDPEQYGELPREVQSVFYWNDSKPERYLDVLDWSVDELGVAAIQALFIMSGWAGSFCAGLSLSLAACSWSPIPKVQTVAVSAIGRLDLEFPAITDGVFAEGAGQTSTSSCSA